MSRILSPLTIATLLFGGTALADVPRVATDIAPVHSLVARIMQGVGTPSLIVTPGASPHEYSLRPSEAKSLQDADLVFWISPDLTPWLGDAITTLSRGANVITLLETPGTIELPLREGALFETHHHDDDHDHSHDSGHDNNPETAHLDDHKDTGETDKDAHHDDHADHDPHAWLSPDNGAAWLDTIAAALSASDPENSPIYRANASAARAELTTLKAEITAILDPVRDRNFIVFHDAYQYFETAFDLPAAGAISLSDATDPSPARIKAIQARVADQNVTCVLAEPQFNQGIVASVMGKSTARTGVLDPLGADLKLDADLYPNMLRNLATSLAKCL